MINQIEKHKMRNVSHKIQFLFAEKRRFGTADRKISIAFVAFEDEMKKAKQV